MAVRNNNGHNVTGVFGPNTSDSVVAAPAPQPGRNNSAPAHQSGGPVRRKIPKSVVGTYKKTDK